MKGRNLARLALFSTCAVIYVDRAQRALWDVKWEGP